MSGCTVKRIDEMEAIYGGAYKRARAELGVTSFGMQVIDFPPNFEHYPEHDHGTDGQEEVYFALGGGAVSRWRASATLSTARPSSGSDRAPRGRSGLATTVCGS